MTMDRYDPPPGIQRDREAEARDQLEPKGPMFGDGSPVPEAIQALIRNDTQVHAVWNLHRDGLVDKLGFYEQCVIHLAAAKQSTLDQLIDEMNRSTRPLVVYGEGPP